MQRFALSDGDSLFDRPLRKKRTAKKKKVTSVYADDDLYDGVDSAEISFMDGRSEPALQIDHKHGRIPGTNYIHRQGNATPQVDELGGIAGNSLKSHHKICIEDMLDDMVSLMNPGCAGVTRAQMKSVLDTYGVVAQKRILEGIPVGVPYFGVIFVNVLKNSEANKKYRCDYVKSLIKRLTNGEQISNYHLARNPDAIAQRLAKLRAYVPAEFQTRVTLKMTAMLKGLYELNANYVGPYKQLVDEMRAKQAAAKGKPPVKAKNRTTGFTNTGDYVQKDNQFHVPRKYSPRPPDMPIITNPEILPAGQRPERPRPGLLVEDRNAVVHTDDAGKQTVQKVPSRPQEADRRGVDEATI